MAALVIGIAYSAEVRAVLALAHGAGMPLQKETPLARHLAGREFCRSSAVLLINVLEAQAHFQVSSPTAPLLTL
jgi:hypothetical protein